MLRTSCLVIRYTPPLHPYTTTRLPAAWWQQSNRRNPSKLQQPQNIQPHLTAQNGQSQNGKSSRSYGSFRADIRSDSKWSPDKWTLVSSATVQKGRLRSRNSCLEQCPGFCRHQSYEMVHMLIVLSTVSI